MLHLTAFTEVSLCDVSRHLACGAVSLVWGVPDVLKHHSAFIVRVKNSKKKSFVGNSKVCVPVVDESCWMGRESNKPIEEIVEGDLVCQLGGWE
jgi:hypothetical protein